MIEMIEFLAVLSLLIGVFSGISAAGGSSLGGKVFLVITLTLTLFTIWSIFDLFWQLAGALMQ